MAAGYTTSASKGGLFTQNENATSLSHVNYLRDAYLASEALAEEIAVIVAQAVEGIVQTDIDTHLNTGTAGAGETLSWTGSDYDWVADSGVTTLTALTDTPVGYGTAGQILATNATSTGTEWVNSDKISIGTTITTDTSITNADLVGNVFYDVSAEAVITVPPGLTGTEPVTFQQTGVDAVTFAAGVGVTIQALGGNLSIANQFGSVSLVPKGGDVYGLIGALV